MAKSFVFSSQFALDDALAERDEAARQLRLRRDECAAAEAAWRDVEGACSQCREELTTLTARMNSSSGDPLLVAADGQAARAGYDALAAWEAELAEHWIKVTWARDRVAQEEGVVRESLARVESLEHLRREECRAFRILSEVLAESERDEASIAAWRSARSGWLREHR
jgi:hypothetical protein